MGTKVIQNLHLTIANHRVKMKFQTGCCMFQLVIHYLILYPDIETMRKVYASYVRKQLEE